MRVLIADDNEAVILTLLERLASVDGVEIVATVRTIPDTLQAVIYLRPDVIVLDMSMPGGSGVDVLEKMRKEDLRPIVIVLTNYSQWQYRKRCYQLGVQFFFDKSGEFERVADVVRDLVRHASNPTSSRLGATGKRAPGGN